MLGFHWVKIMFNNIIWEKWTKDELDPMDDAYKSLCLYITKIWMLKNVGYVYKHGGRWNWWWKTPSSLYEQKQNEKEWNHENPK